MTDVHSKETRSYNMSRIRAKDTKPELLVRKYLFSKGFRYRVNVKDLPGKPDIVLPKYKTVIFIHGCFWHGHEGCKYFVIPKTHTEWWTEKIRKNSENDQKAHTALRKEGWDILTIWEYQLKPKVCAETLESIVLLLQKTWLDKHKRQADKPYLLPQPEIRQVAEKKIPYGNQDSEE